MRSLGVLSACALLLSGCFLDHGRSEPPPEPEIPERPEPEPEPEADVLVSLSSVMLGDDCAETGADMGIADCDGDGCFVPCQQSGMQLLFEVRRLPEILPVEIVEVMVLDAASGEAIEALTPRNPRHWNDEGYVDWDQRLIAVGEERASWDLSAPDWNAIGGGEPWRTYGMPFQVQITLLVGTEEVVLVSDEVYRPADIDT
ncbi:MAG: hypothetical protein AAGE52_33320 [Myxococcota bacterium]